MSNLLDRPSKIVKSSGSLMEDKELMSYLNLRLKTEFKKRLKSFAAMREVTMSELITQVLNDHMIICANEDNKT